MGQVLLRPPKFLQRAPPQTDPQRALVIIPELEGYT